MRKTAAGPAPATGAGAGGGGTGGRGGGAAGGAAVLREREGGCREEEQAATGARARKKQNEYFPPRFFLSLFSLRILIKQKNPKNSFILYTSANSLYMCAFMNSDLSAATMIATPNKT